MFPFSIRSTDSIPVAHQLNDKQRNSDRCTHTDQARAVEPITEGCEECLKAGDSGGHLRAHYRTTGHPIMQSLEVNEDWAWCYVDEVYLRP